MIQYQDNFFLSRVFKIFSFLKFDFPLNNLYLLRLQIVRLLSFLISPFLISRESENGIVDKEEFNFIIEHMNNFSLKVIALKNKNLTEDLCQVFYVDEKKVEKVKRKMLSEVDAESLSETFKILGDMTRVKIIWVLSKGELCVCDISNILGISPSATSHQLRILRGKRLVKHRKDGKMVYYSLDDKHIEKLFKHGLEHIREK